ncbi:MAG: PAS domain S-box protein, partial [Burkholderiales bacterium]
MNRLNFPQSATELLRLLGVAVLYGLTALLVNHYFSINGRACVFYLASGVALAAVLIGGPRYFWAIFFGALVKSLLDEVVWWGAVGAALGSALAALAGAWLIRRNRKFNPTLPSLHDLWGVVFWGAVVACAISAGVGSITLLLRGVVGPDDFLQSLVSWWMGDAFGVVLLTPLLLVWWPVVGQKHLRPSHRQVAEAVLIFAVTSLAGGIVFLDRGHTGLPMVIHLAVDEVAQGYWMFLFVAWTALRLGQRGTTLVLLLIATLGAAGIVQGTGFFRNSVSLSDMTGFWFYNMILAMVGLALATYVTASKRAVERLALSEARISMQYTNALAALDQHAIVATADVQGRILSVNDKFCQISGYTREELLGQDHSMLNSGTHPKGFFKEMYRTLASGESWHAEVCNRAKDGSLYWVQTTVTPFMGDDGKPTMYVAIRADITGRKQTELRLAEREEIFRSIVTQARDGISLIDPKTQRFVEFNDALCAGLGYSREEFSQLRLADIQGDLDEAGTAQRVQAVVDSGHASFDTLHRKKGGELRNSHSTAQVVQIAGRAYIVTVVSDNTERIQAQAAQEAAKEFLEQIVARVPGCLYQFKLHSNGHFSAPYASAGLLALYGLTPEQVREDASDIFAAVHPADQQAFIDSIQRSAREFLLWKHEYRINHPDGSTRWISGNAHPQRGEDKSVLWHGFITDITARKESDAELLQYRSQLEALVEQKTAEVQASQQLFQLAVESADEGVWDLDLVSFELYHSPRMWEMLGYTADELPTTRAAWDAITNPDDVAMFAGEMRAHFENPAHEFKVLVRLRARNGDWRWVLSRGTAGRNAVGRAVRFTGTHQDITEHKQAEEAAIAANRSKSE